MSTSNRKPHNLCAVYAASDVAEVTVPVMRRRRYEFLQSKEDLRFAAGQLACYSELHSVEEDIRMCLERCKALDNEWKKVHKRYPSMKRVDLMKHHLEIAGVVRPGDLENMEPSDIDTVVQVQEFFRTIVRTVGAHMLRKRLRRA